MPNHDQISDAEAAEAMPDWRMLPGRAHVGVDCGSFAAALAFVTAVGELAEEADHHPEIDIRFARVHLALSSHDVDSMSRRDVDLGARIARLARERGHALETSRVAATQIAIDAMDIPAVLPFWRALYRYAPRGDAELVDPEQRGPRVWFQQLDAERPQRNRIHIDVDVAADEVEARLKAVLDAGGRLVNDEFAPSWWVLADPEGNEACLCTFQAKPGA